MYLVIVVFAMILFTGGLSLAAFVHPLYGLLTIIGGLMLGFAHVPWKEVKKEKKTKLLYIGSMVYLLIAMGAAFILMTYFIL
ncbi:hypothetical protein LF817_11175 [Halobacillus sp. A1]|uniref:hypothetical protein n=1 Tax=Halobacillus sp. A1 TaxID=2880262 RepID=UPI0020A69509|nr:hypothetical protein [Halobacillus sp. A1]MCP3031906.1 hypothetical protein [Halobacillus sp. A1]